LSIVIHPLSPPYGYQTQAKGKPALQVPEEIAIVLKIKDWFLEGVAIETICNRLNADGVKTKRNAKGWSHPVVKRIVLNPYYAGVTIFGRFKKEGNKRIPQPPSSWTRGKGQHIPLWDEKTYLDILAENERRESLHARADRYALTGLVVCSVCKTSIHRHGKKWIYLYCREKPPHFAMRYERVLEIVADAVVKELKAYKSNPGSLKVPDFDRQIQEQHKLRLRVQQGYEATPPLYTQLEAQKRIVAIETEIDRLQRAQVRAAQQHHQKQAMLKFAEQDLDRMRNWIINDDPATVNVFLTSLCEKVILTPAGKATVKWRT